MKNKVPAAALLTLSVLAGCSFLPQAGPKHGELVHTGNYELVRINAIVAEESRVDTSRSLGANFVSAPEIDPDVLRYGDVISVSIWEPTGIGLFQSTGGRETLQRIAIDRRGELYIPFIGAVKARGQRLPQLRAGIEQRLTKKTPQPQVLLSQDESQGRAITIQGDVQNAGRYDIEHGFTRLLPMLALANASAKQAEITDLTVRRGNDVGQVWLDEVYNNPAYNIALMPGDSIILRQTPITFYAMGVVKQTGRVLADRRDVSLLRALSLVGSLDDLRADVTGVFLFRAELPAVIEQLAESGQLDSERTNRAPTRQFVYLLDMSEGESVFLADRFQVRDGDTIYVTNAPADDWRKLLSIVLPTLSLPRSATTAAVVGTP